MSITLFDAGLSLSLVNIPDKLPLSFVKSADTGRYWNKKIVEAYLKCNFLEMLWMGEIEEYVVFVLPEARTKIIN